MAAQGLTAKQLRAMLKQAEQVEAKQAQATTQAQALRADIVRCENELREKKATLAAFVTAHGIKRNALTPTAHATADIVAAAKKDKNPMGVQYPEGLTGKSERKAFRLGWLADEAGLAAQAANLTTDEKREACKQLYADGRAAAERRVMQIEQGAPVAV